jgi:non-canonical purine NTP pyrophosphatase (RdgB/HAM1 family)
MIKMPKLIYLTSNKQKVEEANRHFVSRYGFDIEIVNPEFEILEIQAKTSANVVEFSVKYAAEKLGTAVLKSDTSLYVDYLGGLPGPYNAYFDKQIGVEKFLSMLSKVQDRKARIEHSFGFCEPGEAPIIFTGGSSGSIALEARGNRGRWHDFFFIPDGETKTLSELREADEYYEAKFWGTAIDDFAKWYKNKYLLT